MSSWNSFTMLRAMMGKYKKSLITPKPVCCIPTVPMVYKRLGQAQLTCTS